MPKWKTVSLRQKLVEDVEKTLETGRYRSISEFVSEAIRLRLEEVSRTQAIPIEKPSKPLKPLTVEEQLLFMPKHMWAMKTPEGNVRVGVSEYAQKHLNGIAYIRTDPVGSEVKKTQPIGYAETWMFIFDLYPPISGKIVKVNKTLKDNPSTINEDPYAAWIVEIKPDNSIIMDQEMRDLLSLRQYKKWVSKVEGRWASSRPVAY